MSARATIALWAIYYPGKTPEQACAEARAEHDRWYELYKAVGEVLATYNDCQTEADRDAYWKRLAAAQTQLLQHGGVPDRWINQYGRETIPAGICRSCWKPGAIDIDECGGCDQHYHLACYQAMSIRGDLRLAMYARLNGNEEGVRTWERTALAKHIEGGAS